MPASGERAPAQSEERMDEYAVLRFADAERTCEFVMRFCEAIGERGCARSLDRFGDMELWIGPDGLGLPRQAGSSALYASPGAVRAFEELALELSQIGWVVAGKIPEDRRLVFRYESGARPSAA